MTLAARSAQIRICCISISSIRSGHATLNRDSWNFLGAADKEPARRQRAQNPPCTCRVRTEIIEHYCSTDYLALHPTCAAWIHRIELRAPPHGRERSPVGVTWGAKEIPRSPFQPLAMDEAFHFPFCKIGTSGNYLNNADCGA